MAVVVYAEGGSSRKLEGEGGGTTRLTTHAANAPVRGAR